MYRISIHHAHTLGVDAPRLKILTKKITPKYSSEQIFLTLKDFSNIGGQPTLSCQDLMS